MSRLAIFVDDNDATVILQWVMRRRISSGLCRIIRLTRLRSGTRLRMVSIVSGIAWGGPPPLQMPAELANRKVLVGEPER